MDAALYDELHRLEQTHWWFRARRHIVWSLVHRYAGGEPNRRLRICELGCGTGGNLAEVARKHDVVGVECSPQGLAYARRMLGNRVRYGRLPAEIDLAPESFDVVLMTDVLEHIENDAASAERAIRLLRRAESWSRRFLRINGCIRRATRTIIIFGATANEDLPRCGGRRMPERCWSVITTRCCFRRLPRRDWQARLQGAASRATLCCRRERSTTCSPE